MKKYLIIISLALFGFIPQSITHASGGFIIDSFNSNLTIQSDGKLAVKETITVDYSSSLHGIYRDIPVTYQNKDGSSHYTSVNVLSVTDGSNLVNFELINNDNNLRIKIGDANKLVSGRKVYVINYLVTGVISSYADYDELYWNVTGNAWEVMINSVSASVSIPSGNILQATCYEGFENSTDKCSSTLKTNQANFNSTSLLAIGEGMTVSAGFTKGIVPILTVAGPVERFDEYSLNYVFFSFLIVLLLALIFFFRLWWLKGRDSYYEQKSLHDPNRKETTLPLFGAYEAIVPEYEAPAKLRPGELGVLMDERADTVDVSATIVDLAVRGYLTITELKQEQNVLIEKINDLAGGLIPGMVDYLLKKTNKATSDLQAYELDLYNAFFDSRAEVKISDLKDNFSSELQAAKDSLYDLVKTKKLFYDNPEKVRGKYKIGGVMLIIIGAGYAFFFGTILSFVPLAYINLAWSTLGVAIALALSGVLIIIFSRLMPKRTAYGRDLYRQALGYKLFVSGTEKYRQPFFEKENIFMEVLPYAMIFGVTYKLANAMKEMGLEPKANWYISNSAFNASLFINNINSFSTTLSSTMASAPSSSGSGGGGFSGGGFGGGGGGGW